MRNIILDYYNSAKCCQWLFQIINGVSMPLFGYIPTNCGASGATSWDLPLRDGGREQEDWRAWKGVDLLYMYVGGALEELITFLSISIYLQVPKAMYMKAASSCSRVERKALNHSYAGTENAARLFYPVAPGASLNLVAVLWSISTARKATGSLRYNPYKVQIYIILPNFDLIENLSW